MNNFVIVMAVLLGIDSLGKLYWLGSGLIPPRTPSGIAWDMLVNLGVFAWAVYLLVR